MGSSKVLTATMKSVLFVCRGNTCRSLISEAIFKKLLLDRGDSFVKDWHVDSAGMCVKDVDLGEPPNSRTKIVLEEEKIYHLVKDHKARRITSDDVIKFDYILCMDSWNLEATMETRANVSSESVVRMLGSFRKEGDAITSINDPLTGDLEDYKLTYKQCLYFCTNLFNALINT